MLKLSKDDIQKIEKITVLFDSIDTIFRTIDSDTRDEIRNIHNEDGSLGYCIRWGLRASEDIVEIIGEFRKSEADEMLKAMEKMKTSKPIEFTDDEKTRILEKTIKRYKDEGLI